MTHQEDERERLRRLRDRQLQTRNPKKADARTMRYVAQRRGRRQKKITLADMVRELPHRWRGLFLGAIIGMFIWLVLTVLAEGAWVDPVGLACIAVVALLGFVMGQAFDARDELKRL